MKIFLISTLALAATFFAIACGGAPKNSAVQPPNARVAENASVAPQPAATLDELAEARTLYQTNCAKCHKEDGTGGKVNIENVVLNADNLTTEKMKKMADVKYFDYIENGVPDEGMPAFKGRLTEPEIKEIVKYIRTDLQKP